MKGIVSIAGALLLLSSVSAFSAPILFEFSGRFGDCFGECDNAELSALSQQEYSGSLLIPSSAIDREPDGQNHPFSDDLLLSYYELSGPDAQLNFDTTGTTFDVTNATPINAVVGSCNTSFCAFNDNFVWFTFVGPSYSFTLNFGTVYDLSDHSIGIPDIDGYDIFRYLGFGVYRNDFDSSINTKQLSATETEMEISISAVPVPPAIICLSNALLLLLFRQRSQTTLS